MWGKVVTVRRVLVWSWWHHRQTFIQLHFEDLLLKDNAGLMKGHWKINCCRNKLKPKNLPGVINEKAKTCVRRMQHYCMQRAVVSWSWVQRRSCSTFSILHSTCTAINWHQPREYCKQAMTINCKLLPIWVYIYFITAWKWKISPETILESPVSSGTIITLPSHQQPARDVIYHFNLVPGPQRIAQHNTSDVND